MDFGGDMAIHIDTDPCCYIAMDSGMALSGMGWDYVIVSVG